MNVLQTVRRLYSQALSATETWYLKRFSQPRPVELTAVIERLFRYLEMLLLTTLVSFLFSAVGPRPVLLEVLMLFAAGLYLSVPFVRWLGPKIPAKTSIRKRRFFIAGLCFIFAYPPVMLSFGLTSIAVATIQIDTDKAAKNYAEYLRKSRVMACADAHRPFAECEAAYEKPVYIKGKAYLPEPQPSTERTAVVPRTPAKAHPNPQTPKNTSTAHDPRKTVPLPSPTP